jgi:hypothetical protein
MRQSPFRLHILRELALGPRNAQQMRPPGASPEDFSEALLLLEIAGGIRFDMDAIAWSITSIGETLLRCGQDKLQNQ